MTKIALITGIGFYCSLMVASNAVFAGNGGKGKAAEAVEEIAQTIYSSVRSLCKSSSELSSRTVDLTLQVGKKADASSIFGITPNHQKILPVPNEALGFKPGTVSASKLGAGEGKIIIGASLDDKRNLWVPHVFVNADGKAIDGGILSALKVKNRDGMKGNVFVVIDDPDTAKAVAAAADGSKGTKTITCANAACSILKEGGITLSSPEGKDLYLPSQVIKAIMDGRVFNKGGEQVKATIYVTGIDANGNIVNKALLSEGKFAATSVSMATLLYLEYEVLTSLGKSETKSEIVAIPIPSSDPLLIK